MSEEIKGRAVSVVIPCYNKAPYIGATIRSVLAQSVRPGEIIVVDDGSTDDSVDVIRSFGEVVRLYRQENRGESAARNRGIDLAAGEWIALLDADDVWEPRKLEQQLAAAETEAADIVCIYTDVYTFDDGGELLGELKKPEYHRSPRYRVEMLCRWSIVPSSALIRSNALDGLTFPEDVSHSEDMIFFLELRERGPFVRVPECLVGYRKNPETQTASPWHHLHSVVGRFEWLLANRRLFGEEEETSVRESLAEQLLWPHHMALDRLRDIRLARECRRVWRRIHPRSEREQPPSFRRRLYPRWMYLVKDRLAALTGKAG